MRTVSPGLRVMLCTMRRVELSAWGRDVGSVASADHEASELGCWPLRVSVYLATPPCESKYWTATLKVPGRPRYAHSAEHEVSPQEMALPPLASSQGFTSMIL